MKYLIGAALCALLIAGCGGGGGGGGAADGDSAFGLDARVAPSGLNVPTGPVSSQLRLVDAFPNMQRIQGPTFMTHAGDGSNRLFLTDRNGVIWVFANNVNTAAATVMLDLSSQVDDNSGEGGMLGLAFDPDFASNRYFYVSYALAATATAPRKVRVSQFRMTTAGGNVASAASERVVLEYDHANDYHFGGWIGFGPDGMLYLSAGDGGNERAVQETTNLFGKILRMRVNAGTATYSVPADNPFGNLVWAYGFRNPWRCSFDRIGNGQLWCGDVGESDREEINFIQKGKNYGWPFFEGDLPFVDPGTRAYSEFEPAVYMYPHTVGFAVIGGYVYRGSSLPGMVGRYLYSDFASTSLWALQTDGNGRFVANTEATPNLTDVRSFGEDQNGEVYALVGQGTIYRFENAGGSGVIPAMPAVLSGTGLFSDTAALTPAPFMIDYSVNAPFWSDGADKRRWFVLPAGQTVGFDASGNWALPTGAITVKHFDLGTTRVETRVMVHRTDGWAGYTYRWRADHSDADLVAEGGGSATYGSITWNFPSRAQCMGCHTAVTGRALGLNTRQFNRSHSYAVTGRSDNQLRTLNHIGVFSSDIGAASQYAAMPDPKGSAGSLQDRAKAWLDSNCSNCHQPNGPTPVNMDLRYATRLADMRLLGIDNEGSVDGVRIVSGNHQGSLLWQRANSTANGVRMPPLGGSVIDAQALQLLGDWIDSGLQ
jgi:uncharacterized repeat protein (TIGR03806 family)